MVKFYKKYDLTGFKINNYMEKKLNLFRIFLANRLYKLYNNEQINKKYVLEISHLLFVV